MLDRSFAIGHLLPAAAWVAAFWTLSIHFDIEHVLRLPSPPWETHDFVVALLCICILSLLLLGLNHPIIRIYEGYGRFHPLRWLANRRRRQFDRDVIPVIEAQAAIDLARKQSEEPHVTPEHGKKLYNAVRSFPDQREHVLPTRLGNRFRAAEVYSRIVYGLDAIPAWPRLLSVMPEHARRSVSNSKAQLDFFVNLSLGGWLAAASYVVLAAIQQRFEVPWLLGLTVFVALGTYWLALTAASNYGEAVMSCFDLYRDSLAFQLGLIIPPSPDEERIMWQTVSRMMIYRSAARADELQRFRRPVLRHGGDDPDSGPIEPPGQLASLRGKGGSTF